MKLAILIAALVGAGAGCFEDTCDRPVCPGDIADASPGSEWDVEHSFVLPANEFAEAEVSMQAGNQLVVGFDANPEVSWNVHSHAGEVVEHLQGSDTQMEYTFEAPDDGLYYPMWQNDSDAGLNISVRLRLADGDQLVTWY